MWTERLLFHFYVPFLSSLPINLHMIFAIIYRMRYFQKFLRKTKWARWDYWALWYVCLMYSLVVVFSSQVLVGLYLQQGRNSSYQTQKKREEETVFIFCLYACSSAWVKDDSIFFILASLLFCMMDVLGCTRMKCFFLKAALLKKSFSKLLLQFINII